eukprot:TRINITY_DN9797_c0_g1_i5.p1 TRINITY_DN9797_c0_g1~~TRINITY_DN9797_c0_g1_i5.p1  ORF type:complete len:280 (-),score=55.89 TRINITY_DN9797_c0_g1_i5:150-914(-)
MELNSFVFPAPTPSYDATAVAGHLFHIDNIPCVFCPSPSKSGSKVLMYFHGNAEDVGICYSFVDQMSCRLNVHTVMPEYPGYGIYTGSPSAKAISEDAVKVYDFIRLKLGVSEDDIIVFGRSLGSGPATYLTSQRNPSMLILMSGFTSIKAVVKNVACAISCLVKERFRNVDLIGDIKCPKMFLHGLQDDLVPASCSQAMYEKSSEPKGIKVSHNMDHNNFDVFINVTHPIVEFWNDIGYTPTGNVTSEIFQRL